MNLYATCCESAASSLAVTQYPPIAPNRNQVVKLLPQPGHLLGRTQIMPGGTQNQIHKSKQPQQILPKPIPPSTSPQKQSVPRLNTAMPQQTPLLINQPQTQSPALLLNQVLTSGAPVLVQPAGPGGTVHLMLRTPTPTLQSGPGPPQNKMIIANTSQPQATVLIQNRQQVVRFMTAQGPMQLQQIQTPSGPQLIAIPQNQSLSFPANSVLVQGPAANTLQLQQSSGNALQLGQSPSAIIQSNAFPQSSLSNQIPIQNQIFPTTTASAPATTVALKREDKSNAIENAVCVPSGNDQKKIVIDGKVNSKKNVNTVGGSINSFNSGGGSNVILNSLNSGNSISNNLGNNNAAAIKKSNKSGGKGKAEEDALNKNSSKSFGKSDNSIGTPVSGASVAASAASATTAQKNITTSLRQIRPGALANRNKQNQSGEPKEKSEEVNSKSLSNLTRIIDSVASNTEHLISLPPKMDNLTATINSVAENAKSPTPDDIMSKLTLTDVFASESKTLNLNRRPNLTIVQKQTRIVQPEAEDSPTMNKHPVQTSPSSNSNSVLDFEDMPDNYDSLELGAMGATSGGVQTRPETAQGGFVQDRNPPPPTRGIFQGQEDPKKAKKKSTSCGKKKGKKEENRVDLWDLMKSAGIGDDEFDEPSEMSTFSQEATAIGEPLEIPAAETDLLAQFQSTSQLPAGIRVVVGEDGRPVIINGGNVLIPENVQNSSSGMGAAADAPSDAEAVLQNMILPENVFNFTPQAFATAQTQLNQLIQDHGGLATSSADQQLLSQIFGATPSSAVANNGAGSISSNSNTSVIQSSNSSSAAATNVQNQPLPSSNNENVLVSVTSTNNSEVGQSSGLMTQKQEAKPEFIGEPPPGLPPLGPDSLVITNNNGVPTLVASPALMQYLQTHQGIIQFQHDPVTKTIQPSLIIPHPQPKVESVQHSALSQEARIDKMTVTGPNNGRTLNTVQELQSQTELKAASVEIAGDDQKAGLNNLLGPATNSNLTNPNVVKLNMVKFVKDNSSLLQLATETNSLISFKERNKTLSEKDVAEIDKKIQQNRAILDQCLLMENNRGGGSQVNSSTLPNVIVKEGGGNGGGGSNSKDGVTYQVDTSEKLFMMTNKTTTTTKTKTLEDLQNLDMTLIKGFHPPPNTNSPSSNSDFQAKFLESIGMANKTSPKATVSIGTGSSGSQPSLQPPSGKRGRKKKEKIQSQSTQVDVKATVPCLTFNIAELTPEQNVRLNQALQSRGPVVNQIENLDAIKQIIHEEVRKITSNSLDNPNIRFTTSAGLPIEDQDLSDQSLRTANVLLGNSNLNQILEPPPNQGNVISLQGNELIAINSGNQQIFASQNHHQVLSGNHFVSSNNQILAIGGSHNQLVSLGNPINSSNQIVTLGSPPSLMSVAGNNVQASPGAVIVGGNGNVVAIVHQNAAPTAGQNSTGIVQRIQTIQLTTPKQQHFKTIQSQIQTLSSKANRTQTEQATLQKLIVEQQKILSTGKLVQTFPGQQVHGMQIVSQSIQNSNRLYQTQATSQLQQHQQQSSSQLSQTPSQVHQSSQSLQQSQSLTFITNNSNPQLPKSNFSSQSVVSCGTNTSDFNSSTSVQPNIPKMSVPPTVLISDVPTSNYGPLYVNPNASGKNVTKCEKGTSPIQIQMGTQTVTNMEYRSGKMSTGTMTSPNTGKPQAVVAPAIVIQQTENQSPTYQLKPRHQSAANEPLRNSVPALNRTAFIEQQMRTDQAGATMPDTRTPFSSKSDACKRLIRYHVMDEKALSPQDLATADDIFEATAQHLLDKFRMMKEKYKYLLMLESMREVSTAERIMVDRNFIIEERVELEDLREKEKRLQEEFENPTIVYRNAADSPAIKTEFALDDDVKAEMNDLIGSEEVKREMADEEGDVKESLISKNKNISDINGDSLKGNPFKPTEANRNEDLAKIKSETKECKNTRTSVGSFSSIEDSFNISNNSNNNNDNNSNKCKGKNGRTFSEGSSKGSLDGSRDEDSGADINAQVQSAIDSILNLQKCETLSEALEEAGGRSTPGKRPKKGKRKFGTTDTSSAESSRKRPKMKRIGGKKERSPSGEEEAEGDGDSEVEEEEEEGEEDVEGEREEAEEEAGSSDADPILDEAIRSILTS